MVTTLYQCNMHEDKGKFNLILTHHRRWLWVEGGCRSYQLLRPFSRCLLPPGPGKLLLCSQFRRSDGRSLDQRCRPSCCHTTNHHPTTGRPCHQHARSEACHYFYNPATLYSIHTCPQPMDSWEHSTLQHIWLEKGCNIQITYFFHTWLNNTK